MSLDWDGKIRMDCSSPYAMAGLIALKDRFDVAFACDTDHDRHGIVTRSAGLLNPNHYLAAAISYLFPNRPGWREDAGVGKTLVSSSIIDRVAASLGRHLVEVPVGFKWFVDGLLDGSLGFGGEESAGASFLRQRWRGLVHRQGRHHPGAAGGRNFGAHRQGSRRDLCALTERFGAPVYERIDAPPPRSKRRCSPNFRPDQVSAKELAGDPIEAS